MHEIIVVKKVLFTKINTMIYGLGMYDIEPSNPLFSSAYSGLTDFKYVNWKLKYEGIPSQLGMD